MNRNFISAVGLTVGIVVAAATVSDAEAGRRGHGGFHGGWHDDYGRHWDKPKYRHQYGFHGYHRTCHHFLKKARFTGHRYWWRKYQRCVRTTY